ncbi:hypothetical protein AB0I77_31940 [Streptomyces sp. NPDC050619]|uniref:hypothetical protein n=1 Tax=Streptomyces sp. NPDC050619 TaxID=3157214 RepID=UPI00341B76FF
MSDTPENSDNLSQRVEAHRAALASLLDQSGVDVSPSAPAGVAPRADVLISASEDPWHDGRGNSGRDREKKAEKKAEEKKAEEKKDETE